MFRQALRLNPQLAGANLFLGIDYTKLGEGLKALPYLRTTVKLKPDQAEAWSWLATAEEMSGNIYQEIQALEGGLRRHPEGIDLLYLLGHAYERLGKQEANAIERRGAGSSYAEQLLAESYLTADQLGEAIIHIQKALALSPDQPDLHLRLGEVFLRAGNWRRAAEEFEAELRLRPHNLAARVRRGETRLIEGDVDGALADWAQAASTDEVQAEVILGIRDLGFGDARFEQLPDPVRQGIEFLRPRFADPNKPGARLALIFLSSQVGATGPLPSPKIRPSVFCSADAIRRWLDQDQFSRLLECQPESLDVVASGKTRFRLARALFEAGQCGQALETLAKLPRPEAASAEARYWRARCYNRLARATYLRVFSAAPDSY